MKALRHRGLITLAEARQGDAGDVSFRTSASASPDRVFPFILSHTKEFGHFGLPGFYGLLKAAENNFSGKET